MSERGSWWEPIKAPQWESKTTKPYKAVKSIIVDVSEQPPSVTTTFSPEVKFLPPRLTPESVRRILKPLNKRRGV